jgi:hypothetical protein
MMQHPVQNGPGHLFIVEDVDPAGKLDICIDDQSITFIALGNDLKQQLGACPVQRHITPFVANQKFRFGELLHKDGQSPALLGFRKPVYQSRRSEESGLNAPFTGLDA